MARSLVNAVAAYFYVLPIIYRLKYVLPMQVCLVTFSHDRHFVTSTDCSIGSSSPCSSNLEILGGLPFPIPGDLLNPGIKPKSTFWPVDSLPLSHWGIVFLLAPS